MTGRKCVLCWFSLTAHCGKAWTQLLVWKKHLEKWKAFTSIALLKTLLPSGLSRICSRSQILTCILQDAGIDFFLGDWYPLGALLCKLGQESLQSPQWRTPPGSPRRWWGTSQGYTVLPPVIFLFSDHVSTTSQGNMPVSLAVIVCLTSLTFLLVIPPADSITAKCLVEINPLYTTCGYFCLQLYITSWDRFLPPRSM